MNEAAPQTEIRLFGPQADALESSSKELLVGGCDGPCGTSFLLRAAGIVLAASFPEAEVLLVQSDPEELRETHVEGDGGIVALLTDMALTAPAR